MRVNNNNLIEWDEDDLSSFFDISQQWINALIDVWNINVSLNGFDNWILNTTWDYVHIVWTIDPSKPVEYITVTHRDTKGQATITDYKLEKFEPSSHYFWFNAYRYYNSLTVNDKNTYEFKFYDKDMKLIFKKLVIINHSYIWKWK